MTEKLRDQVLAAFKLTPKQQEAALERGRDVAVTAGAGSGKTSTLVARYATLLADGIDMRRIVAITFSEKAAREMRSRIRKTLGELVLQTASDQERQFWQELNSKMDSARISTIHSLCAEILRAYPAEAVVDPKFEVVEESLATALRVQVVQDTLASLVGKRNFEPLFRIFSIKDLTNLLAYLLNHRLEAFEALASTLDTRQVICRELNAMLHTPEIADPITELRSLHGSALAVDAGDALSAQIEELLDLWNDAENRLASEDSLACARQLFIARREKMGLRAGNKGSAAKEALKGLQVAYDELLNPICGGKTANDEPPSAEGEAQFAQALALIKPAFELLTTAYRNGLNQLGGLDFDDLESGAAQLLKRPEIRALWQGQLDAVLVDEFQDTNQRQRDIVEALAGSSGSLFVVGDAKQSIYRFRRADVTVFRAIRHSIKFKGGLPIDLNETFRAHAALLASMNDVLRVVMGEKEDTSRPYYEPFAALVANHTEPREGFKAPHLEFVLGAGEEAESARQAMAKALATRLLELQKQKQIKSWDDVALLFRATTGFPYYESAFEEANIPFVTVAGRGFYDRAEIRDLLNLLRALADPTDDLAMAGLLRSPAFGLTDAALYQLRWQGDTTNHYWAALHADLSTLSDSDRQRAIRLVAILENLIPQVDRIPVAELLKKLVDATDYRSILAIEDNSGGGGRLWRNLDKLIEDAQTSGKINVRDFLDYLTVINDAGAREGEAPAEALGAVRLMTIHKSKGLQFPIVVLADASRRPGGGRDSAFLLQELGLSFKLDPEPMLYRLAKVLDRRQSDAEEHRVLYVALTRAQEKLIISGHVTASSVKGWSSSAWLKELCDAANVDVNGVINQAGGEVIAHTMQGHEVRACALPAESTGLKAESFGDKKLPTGPDLQPIYAPLSVKVASVSEEDSLQARNWRVTGQLALIPSGAVGTMVHKAIELWLFPCDLSLIPLLETTALDEGLVVKVHRDAAIDQAVELLSRLQAHPIRGEIEAVAEIYHELPYTRMVADHAETGYIDLLYKDNAGWHILDFKTDSIQNAEYRDELVTIYSQQMRRYANVVETMLGQPVQARICFLDDQSKVELVII
ncbi:MAG: UvrD-helicase domain-containing protein [Anaerolineaceae bacterium]